MAGIKEGRVAWNVLWTDARVQIPAIAHLRWRLLANSLRSTRGRMELFSRIAVGVIFSVAAVGGSLGLGGAAWWFVSQRTPELVALLLWPVFLFWQFFPILANAFTENLDSSNLLRFPLSYPSYFAVRLVYGAIDPAMMMGSLWLLGIWIGVGLASPRLLPAAAVALFALAAFNVLFSRMTFAWLESWLAQRRMREVLGLLFIVIMSVQLILPLTGFRRKTHDPRIFNIARQVSPLQRALPPGLAAEMVTRAFRGHTAAELGYFGLLCCYGGAVLWLLHLRLREQYRGENLSESGAPVALPHEIRAAGGGKNFGLRGGGQVAAVLAKELLYLSRSGPMLLTILVPIFMVLIFRNGGGGLLEMQPTLAFPIVCGYSLLLLTNLIYNNFGADGAGIQFFFASPARFRQIVLGKNCAHMVVFGLEIAIALATVSVAYRAPALDVFLASVAGILFAAPVNMAAGNLLSIYFPKKIDFSTFGRQRASPTTILASFGVQIAVLGTGALTILFSRKHGSSWLAFLIFLGLSTLSWMGYAWVLRRIESIALNHREGLIGELSRS